MHSNTNRQQHRNAAAEWRATNHRPTPNQPKPTRRRRPCTIGRIVRAMFGMQRADER